jgi:nitroimidazol reductase NimA-like FMN-containing flavoprotein (pyridoxamine 5'-phosphate oxidase superfamily)
VLSICSSDNEGYGIPLNYVYMNDAIYFHCALEGRKINELNKNDRISFCVVGKTEILPEKFTAKYESVIVFGKALEVKGQEKRNALIGLVKKFSRDFLQEGINTIDKMIDKTGVYKIIISNITGKANRG